MRPIDAEKFDTIAYSQAEMQAQGYEDSFDDGVRYLAEQIDAAPTLDVAPVVHAKWIIEKRGNFVYVRCDSCGEYAYKCFTDDFAEQYLSNYCLNCGAKMDGERKEGAE